jgi:hypothetical protein
MSKHLNLKDHNATAVPENRRRPRKALLPLSNTSTPLQANDQLHTIPIQVQVTASVSAPCYVAGANEILQLRYAASAFERRKLLEPCTVPFRPLLDLESFFPRQNLISIHTDSSAMRHGLAHVSVDTSAPSSL